jgi:hypothetical protein
MGRGGGGDRSHQSRDLVAEFIDKPLPPGYICYRCGQRGGCTVTVSVRALLCIV